MVKCLKSGLRNRFCDVLFDYYLKKRLKQILKVV